MYAFLIQCHPQQFWGPRPKAMWGTLKTTGDPSNDTKRPNTHKLLRWSSFKDLISITPNKLNL